MVRYSPTPPPLLKIQKLARRGGAHLQSQLPGKLRQENCLNPGGRGCGEPRWCHCTSAWATRVKLCLKTKQNPKISQAWWWVPIIPATQEAEAENCLNPGGEGCSEPELNHCTPAWATEQDSISKKEIKKLKALSFG